MNDETVIEVEVPLGGRGVKISTPCSVGKSCEEISAFLEKALGTVKSRSRTANYYKTRKRKVRITAGVVAE